MRWLLKATTALVLVAQTAGLAAACDGCGKGGKELPGVPQPAGQVMPPNSYSPPQAMPLMPPAQMTPGTTTIPPGEAHCPCCPCGAGGRRAPDIGMTGFAPTDYPPTGYGPRRPRGPRSGDGGSCPCSQSGPVPPVSAAQTALSRGHFPVAPPPGACSVPGCSMAAPGAYPPAQYSTQYYTPELPVQANWPSGRVR